MVWRFNVIINPSTFRCPMEGLCAARFFGGADAVPLCLVLLGVLMILHGLKLKSIRAWMSVTKKHMATGLCMLRVMKIGQWHWPNCTAVWDLNRGNGGNIRNFLIRREAFCCLDVNSSRVSTAEMSGNFLVGHSVSMVCKCCTMTVVYGTCPLSNGMISRIA